MRPDRGHTVTDNAPSGERELSRPSKVGVPLAALTIVGAVWLALRLSPSAPVVPQNDTLRPTAVGELLGFRSDAWHLPDGELLGFVEIPGGTFVMGSDPGLDRSAFDLERWSSTSTQGRVDLPTFYMGRFEVTVAQLGAFVDATGHTLDPLALQAPPDHPASLVSWPDAVAYARWLGTALRESPATPPRLEALLRDGWQISLPTEAEWEKAARGTDGRVYPWGNESDPDRANYGGRSSTPVGSYECPACTFGLSDMSGNVWEWTRSPYQPYPYDATDDGDNLEGDALWVIRGGSFGDPEGFVRAANRGRADPGARRPFIGFRISMSR
jgi:formylglycine-generating enzyme required for sulfatase activity